MDVLRPFRTLLSIKHDVARTWQAKGKHLVGWSCAYTPEELIYAANSIPIMVSGSLEPSKHADVYLPINTCSFVRSCFDSALKGDYEYLDGLVISNSCDNRNKIFDLWKHHVKIPYVHFINTPHTRTEGTHNFFYDEILRFKTSLQVTFGEKLSDTTLKNAIRIFNENRLLLKKVYDLRMKDPPLISGAEALEIVLSSMVTSKEEHNLLLKRLLAGASNRADPPKGGVRLLVSGSVMDNSKPIRIIEAMGGSVVADDWCTGSKYFWDLVSSHGDPLRAIAKRYLDKVPSSFMLEPGTNFSHTIEMAERFDVEAVIVFALKFCDTHMFDAPQLVKEFEARDLPILYLEWEHSLSGSAQLKTRIEAFLEMVKGVG